MTDPALTERLQDYLRRVAAANYQAVPLPPLTLFFHPQSAVPYFSYAIPGRPVGGEALAALPALRAEFARRGRAVRFEFIAEYAPELGPALERQGLRCEGRLPLMVCTAESFGQAAPDLGSALERQGLRCEGRLPPIVCTAESSRTAALPDGLTCEVLDASATPAQMQVLRTTQNRGFDPTAPEAPLAEAEAELARMGAARAWLARLDGRPVAAAYLMAPLGGVAELAGVTTLAAWRGRGIATALVAQATGAALASGVELVCLSAEHGADGVYRRVGFAEVGTAVAYREAAAEAAPTRHG